MDLQRRAVYLTLCNQTPLKPAIFCLFILFASLITREEVSVKSQQNFLNLCIGSGTLSGSGFRRIDEKFLQTAKDNATEHSGKVIFAVGLVVLLPSGVN